MTFGHRISLHLHTQRCKHARGLPVDYCREALLQGLSVVGFSDHAPFPDERYNGSRMDYAELEDYGREVELARAAHPELRVLKGFEVDFFDSVGRAFYEDTFLGRCGADYLIAGTHFLEPFDPAFNQWDDRNVFGPAEVRRHVESHIAAMASGLFTCLCHPDTFARCCPSWTPELRALCGELVEASIALRVPLELNAYGLRKPPVRHPEGERPQYPWRPFWELVAEKRAPVVIGSDAHAPGDVWARCDELLGLAAELDLEVVNARVAAGLRGAGAAR